MLFLSIKEGMHLIIIVICNYDQFSFGVIDINQKRIGIGI
jgi:hypothetical protein